MTTITLAPMARTYANNGAHAEQVLAYTLTGEIRPHGNAHWAVDSDIPEYHMSVKSDRFTLASDLMGETLADKVTDYFMRTASSQFAYVAGNGIAYVMNAVEFESFLLTFCKMERDSTKNGGRMKVRFPHESKAVMAWLMARA